MATNVTAQQVTNLMTDCTLDTEIVESVIDDAQALVDSVLADCTELTTAQSDSIVKWLSAHMLASGPCRQAVEEQLGEARVKYDYANSLGEKLNSTKYGQMVLTLDTCGKMEQAGKQSIKIRAIQNFD